MRIESKPAKPRLTPMRSLIGKGMGCKCFEDMDFDQDRLWVCKLFPWLLQRLRFLLPVEEFMHFLWFLLLVLDNWKAHLPQPLELPEPLDSPKLLPVAQRLRSWPRPLPKKSQPPLQNLDAPRPPAPRLRLQIQKRNFPLADVVISGLPPPAAPAPLAEPSFTLLWLFGFSLSWSFSILEGSLSLEPLFSLGFLLVPRFPFWLLFWKWVRLVLRLLEERVKVGVGLELRVKAGLWRIQHLRLLAVRVLMEQLGLAPLLLVQLEALEKSRLLWSPF